VKTREGLTPAAPGIEAGAPGPEAPPYRSRGVLTPLLLGMFLRALQITIIAPSLVNIAQSLGATLAQVGWVMAVYATGSLVAQPVAGKLSDARGRRRTFAGALLFFGTGSVLCALARSLPELVAGRVVQSLGAGALQPAAIALVGERLPQERRNTALYALYGMFAVAGVIGAIAGGVLVDLGIVWRLPYPWHLIFWLGVPLAALALLLTWRLEPDRVTPQRIAFDVPGLAGIAVVAVCLMAAANAAAPGAWVWLGGALAGGALAVVWERQVREPLFDPAVFAGAGPRRLYTLAVITGIPIFSLTMYAAAYYMTEFGASAAQAGLALLALAIPLGAGQGAGSSLVRRMPPSVVLWVALTALAAGEALLGVVRIPALVLAAFAVAGCGIGLGSALPNALLLRYVRPAISGSATGFLTMLASSGAITAPAAVSAWLTYTGIAPREGLRLEFVMSSVLAAACVPLAARLPRPGD
jgi:MFS family permease